MSFAPESLPMSRRRPRVEVTAGEVEDYLAGKVSADDLARKKHCGRTTVFVAMHRSGVPALKSGRRKLLLTEREVRDYKAGEATGAGIARRAGDISFSAVYRRLHEAGVDVKCGRTARTKSLAAQARGLRARGRTYQEVADALGVTISYAWHLVNKIPAGPPGA